MKQISDIEWISNDGTIRFLNMDCRDFMVNCKDGEFDLNLSDPPYGIKASKPSKKPSLTKKINNYAHKNWDDNVISDDLVSELIRVSNNQILFGVNYYCNNLTVGGRLVWDKLNGDSDQFDCEIAYCSYNNRTDVVYCMWQGMFQGRYCGSDVRRGMVQEGDKRLNEIRIHPTQKPVKLYRWVLSKYTKPTDVILDCFGGSMSSAIACHMEKRRLIIIELDNNYFKEAIERFSIYEQQLTLF